MYDLLQCHKTLPRCPQSVICCVWMSTINSSCLSVQNWPTGRYNGSTGQVCIIQRNFSAQNFKQMLCRKLTRFTERKINKDTINVSMCAGACHCLRNNPNRAMLRVVRTNCSDTIATDHDCCYRRSVTVIVLTVQGPSGKTNSICLVLKLSPCYKCNLFLFG